MITSIISHGTHCRIESETLSNGNKVYNVKVGVTGRVWLMSFECDNLTCALALLNEIEKCVGVSQEDKRKGG